MTRPSRARRRASQTKGLSFSSTTTVYALTTRRRAQFCAGHGKRSRNGRLNQLTTGLIKKISLPVGGGPVCVESQVMSWDEMYRNIYIHHRQTPRTGG